MGDLMFPILRDEQIKAVPWEVLAAHEQQAQSNHGQALKRLAQRGGLSCMEACSIIADVPFRDMRTDVKKSYWRALLMRHVYEHEVNSTAHSKEEEVVPEEHEVIDEYIGDCPCYSLGGDMDYAEMEADIDGEWVRVDDVKANILRKLNANKLEPKP